MVVDGSSSTGSHHTYREIPTTIMDSSPITQSSSPPRTALKNLTNITQKLLPPSALHKPLMNVKKTWSMLMVASQASDAALFTSWWLDQTQTQRIQIPSRHCPLLRERKPSRLQHCERESIAKISEEWSEWETESCISNSPEYVNRRRCRSKRAGSEEYQKSKSFDRWNLDCRPTTLHQKHHKIHPPPPHRQQSRSSLRQIDCTWFLPLTCEFRPKVWPSRRWIELFGLRRGNFRAFVRTWGLSPAYWRFPAISRLCRGRQLILS